MYSIYNDIIRASLHLVVVEVGYQQHDTITLLPSAVIRRFVQQLIQFLGKSLHNVCTCKGIKA